MKQSESQQQKQKGKLYLLTIQDDFGTIQKVLTDTNYDQLWLLGVNESKSMRGYWTMFDMINNNWRFVDGNYRAQITK
jgi:hypothetical protein